MTSGHFYSPASSALGVIFFIFTESRHVIPNAARIIPTPAMTLYPTGTVNVHFTIPISFKNKAASGFMIKLFTITPITVDKMTAGVKEGAVCKINCPVVKSNGFRIP